MLTYVWKNIWYLRNKKCLSLSVWWLKSCHWSHVLPSAPVKSTTVNRFLCFSCIMWICLSLSSLSASWVLMPQLWAAVLGITIWTAAPWGAVSLWPASPLLHHPALRAAKRGSIARDPDTGLGAMQCRGWGGGMSVPKGCSLRWDAVVQCGQTDILK